MEPLRYLFSASEFEIDFESFVYSFAVHRLVSSFSPPFFLGGLTAAALKSEAAVDGNRKEMADRVASLQARLGNRELENYAVRASPLWYEYDLFVFCFAYVYFVLPFSIYLVSGSPFFPPS